jgi:hypothetical protein
VSGTISLPGPALAPLTLRRAAEQVAERLTTALALGPTEDALHGLLRRVEHTGSGSP